jgi:hypothetical protein
MEYSVSRLHLMPRKVHVPSFQPSVFSACAVIRKVYCRCHQKSGRKRTTRKPNCEMAAAFYPSCPLVVRLPRQNDASFTILQISMGCQSHRHRRNR